MEWTHILNNDSKKILKDVLFIKNKLPLPTIDHTITLLTPYSNKIFTLYKNIIHENKELLPYCNIRTISNTTNKLPLIMKYYSHLENPNKTKKIKTINQFALFYNNSSLQFKHNMLHNIEKLFSSSIPTTKDKELYKRLYYFIQTFVPIHVQDYIEKKCNQQCTINNNNITIHFYKNSNDKINKLVFYRTTFMLDFFKSNRILKLYIATTPFKKLFPKKKCDIMGAEQANTGYNWGNVITLYRNEELLKVLLHELVHFLKLEKGINNDLHIQHFIKHGLDVESESFHPLETFTEIIANIIHCFLFTSELILLHNMNEKEFIKVFKELLELERLFSLIQTAKIIHHFGLDDFTDIFSYDTCLRDIKKNCKKKLKDSPKIKQSSNILSYFIIRSALFYSIDSFVSLLIKMSTSSDMFKYNVKYSSDYLKLVKSSLQKKSFIKTINQLMHFIKENTSSFSKEFLTTSRMTLIDHS